MLRNAPSRTCRRHWPRIWLVCLAVTVLVAACGRSPAPAEAPKQVLELTFASTMDDSGVDRAVTRKFAELVSELSDGTMKVNLFLAGQLGDEREILELMKLGEIDLAYLTQHAVLYYPDYNVTMVPFLFPDFDTIEEFLLVEIFDVIQERIRERGGLVHLGVIHGYGFRWTTSSRAFTNPEELRGLKIRMPNIPEWIAVWDGMGALTTPVPASEIVTALKTGVVDAQENYLTNIHGRQLWEVQKYAIATDHIELPQHWLASLKTWEQLTEEQQAILKTAAREAADYIKPQVEEMNRQFIEEFRKQGMVIIYPDRQALMQAAWPRVEHILREQLAPGVYDAATRVIGR